MTGWATRCAATIRWAARSWSSQKSTRSGRRPRTKLDDRVARGNSHQDRRARRIRLRAAHGQFRSPSPFDARRAPPDRRPRWRADQAHPAGHRLPAHRNRKADGGAALAAGRGRHRPPRLPLPSHQQPCLCAGCREADGGRGPASRAGAARDHVRAHAPVVAPGVDGHERARAGRDVHAHVLLSRARADHGPQRGDLRLPAEDAKVLGASGPMLRGSGVAWDLRKSMPYSGYESYDFEVAVSNDCDCYGRYLVRIKEMREAVKILRQALDRLPDGPVNIDDRKMLPPPREELETSMEAVIHHFKLFTEGYTVPAGDAYVAVESGRGENGCYIVSDGTHKPRRVKFRSASFVNLQALERMSLNHMVADMIAIIGTADAVLGDVDR